MGWHITSKQLLDVPGLPRVNCDQSNGGLYESQQVILLADIHELAIEFRSNSNQYREVFTVNLQLSLSRCNVLQGTFCTVPSSCAGFALADGICCMYEISKSGVCCEVVDRDMECCNSGVLDATGVCQGTAVSIDYNGNACEVNIMHSSLGICLTLLDVVMHLKP